MYLEVELLLDTQFSSLFTALKLVASQSASVSTAKLLCNIEEKNSLMFIDKQRGDAQLILTNETNGP